MSSRNPGWKSLICYRFVAWPVVLVSRFRVGFVNLRAQGPALRFPRRFLCLARVTQYSATEETGSQLQLPSAPPALLENRSGEVCSWMATPFPLKRVTLAFALG